MTDNSDAYQKNYYESIRGELLDIIKDKLTPIANHYSYSDQPLDQKIQWKPCVLVLGNYSSGKSTFINELLGREIQRTGQAPTDDSFTVISYDSDTELEERDGQALLSNPEFPFMGLKKHGQRLTSHVRLKYCNAPILEGLALIDTPGMLDSIAERDRGYDYQRVIGELAELSDLILVMFDPHKAGTIRETYESLRKTLPKSTYEDRVVFILNRIDECSHLGDLLRVYGTLCWNLSQMTGRKDIPHIRLTWSEATQNSDNQAFLGLLENQRSELRTAIRNAPRHRLDHMTTFVEEHAARLEGFTKALLNYQIKHQKISYKSFTIGMLIAVFASAWSFLLLPDIVPTEAWLVPTIIGIAITVTFIVFFILQTIWQGAFKKQSRRNPEQLLFLENQEDEDSFSYMKEAITKRLSDQNNIDSKKSLRNHIKTLKAIRQQEAPEIRKALSNSP